MATTLRDVAAQAGVSIITVSRVMRGERYIAAGTRERVLAAASALGYHPDLGARRLKSGRTYVVGFVVPNIANPFFSHLIKSAERVLYEEVPDYELVVCDTGGRAERERSALALLSGRRAEGVLLASTGGAETAALVQGLARDGSVPVVLLDNELPGAHADLVTVDNRAAARTLMAHLLGHLLAPGRATIGIITGLLRETSAADRLAGCRDALVERGLDPDCLLVGEGDWTEESGRRVVEGWLGLSQPPAAIFSSQNFMTVGAVLALRSQGLAVGRDVALVSFDDVEFGCLLTPAWTTIDYSLDQIGEAAARVLLARIDGRAAPGPQRLLMPHRLLVRGSCGCSRTEF